MFPQKYIKKMQMDLIIFDVGREGHVTGQEYEE